MSITSMYHRGMFNIVVMVAYFIFVYMTFWFVVSIILRRNDVADLAWALGFVFITIILSVSHPSENHLSLISLLVSIWGIRLASHIYNRLKNNPEDKRYYGWRLSWGKYFVIRSYLQVFLLQGLFMFLISLSIILSISSKVLTIQWVGLAGLIVWITGFLFESISDKQLSNFIKTKKTGQIMQSGLWKYSRHPNYFGEVTQWWGIALIAFESSHRLFLFLSPITITLLILFVSGVPLLEKKYQDNPEYIKYKKKTSIFLPWIPKNN